MQIWDTSNWELFWLLRLSATPFLMKNNVQKWMQVTQCLFLMSTFLSHANPCHLFFFACNLPSPVCLHFVCMRFSYDSCDKVSPSIWTVRQPGLPQKKSFPLPWQQGLDLGAFLWSLINTRHGSGEERGDEHGSIQDLHQQPGLRETDGIFLQTSSAVSTLKCSAAVQRWLLSNRCSVWLLEQGEELHFVQKHGTLYKTTIMQLLH